MTQDNGARALAERLAALETSDVWSGNTTDWSDVADAILANGAAFLPDAAELDRLRRIEALVEHGPHWSPHPDVLDRVPADRDWGKSLIAVADLRAALAPEGSAGTACDETKAAADDHYKRWETFGHVCTGRHIEPGHECACGAMWAAEGSARDGG